MNGTLKKELKKVEHEYDYQRTVNLGRYVRSVSPNLLAQKQDPQKAVHFSLEKESNGKSKHNIKTRVTTCAQGIRNRIHNLRVILSDWIFLLVLGVIVAFLSISVDMMIFYVQEVQSWTVKFNFGHIYDEPFWVWCCNKGMWMIYTIGMIAASATLVHYVSPQAIGSGIPEMKTIIRGVVLKDYLTFRTLVSKIFGVALSLGSGVPIGKMGPFVHISSVVANQMSRYAARLDPAFGNETRRVELLAAACAVGVACTFSAPVGGVLFSIEVTTMYFSVRSYWRGFFAACCGATTIRLLRGYVAKTEVTVNAFFQTSFAPDAFDAKELPLFALLGIICGILGAVYISLYRTIVMFLRNNKCAKSIFQRHWIVYPIVVSFVFSVVAFPHGLGLFSTGRLKFGMNLLDFFSNCTFTAPPGSPVSCGTEIFTHWLNRGNIITLLALFIVIHFVFSIICMTLPVPSGVFMPVFVLGAAIGRIIGELISLSLVGGMLADKHIYPGVYAVVGAASFSASVTHTVSVSVMIFEITGQLHFILPVMLSVVLSNAVCAYLQPSIFDTIIKIKHLPFLPDIPPSSNLAHTVCAEQMMISPVKYLTRITTYAKLRQLLVDAPNIRIFPVVDSEASQMLIGTVSRRFLLEQLQEKVGEAAHRAEAERRVRLAISTIDQHFKNTLMESQMSSKRTQSDSDLKRKNTVASMNREELERHRKPSRFLVLPSPVAEEPTVFPPPSSSRRNSFNRRNAFCSMAEAEENRYLPDEAPSEDSQGHKSHFTIHHISSDYQALVKSYMKQAKKYLHLMQFGHSKKEEGPLQQFDLTPEEREEWEKEQLAETVEFTEEMIDPAPFQLVKRTSLFKIHSIFSMLQLSKAYVTDCGRLIGVVALSDLRHELERSENTRDQAPKVSSLKYPPEKLRPIPSDISLMSFEGSTAIVDILTPTLTVIRPSSLELSSRDLTRIDDLESQFTAPAVRKSSSLRVPGVKISPTDLSFFNPRHRASLNVEHHEELVEAVAYLRRKSHAPISEKEKDDYGDENKNEK